MLIGDLTTRSLAAALDGLSRRGEAFRDNIANVETPGYLARRVNFETTLRAAMEGGEPSDASFEVTRSLAPTRLNGNNVAVDQELVGLTENGLRGQLVVEALNGKYRAIRTALGSGI